MHKSELKTGVIYAVKWHDGYAPVKVIDAEHTYTLRDWRGYWGREDDLDDWQKETNEEELAHLAWQRDEQWTVSPRHVGDDTHGVLVAGRANFIWPDSWHRMTEADKETAVGSISPREVLTLTGHDNRAGWVRGTPVGVINPDALVGEWEELMAPIRRERAETERIAAKDLAHRRAQWAGIERQVDREQAEMLRLTKLMLGLKWCLGLTIAGAFLAALTGNATASTLPIGVSLGACIVVMLATNARIRKLQR